MSESLPAPADAERFNWLERRGDDFPYYRGQPVEISAGQWWLVMSGVAIGYAVLILPPPFLRGSIASFVPAILYFAIPLATLAYVAGPAWTAIFRRVGIKDVLLMAGFAILNIAVTLVVGRIMISMMDTTANEAVKSVGTKTGGDVVMFFARTGLQLFGEEVMSILPCLALLTWLAGWQGMGRKPAIIVAVLLVVALFAAAHLHTYGWNVAQAVIGVGMARIVLILPYIMTKNIWVSSGAHILNDWMMFVVSLLANAAASSGG